MVADTRADLLVHPSFALLLLLARSLACPLALGGMTTSRSRLSGRMIFIGLVASPIPVEERVPQVSILVLMVSVLLDLVKLTVLIFFLSSFPLIMAFGLSPRAFDLVALVCIVLVNCVAAQGLSHAAEPSPQ